MVRWLIVFAALLLVGCATSRPPLVSALPAVVNYTDAEKDAINAERGTVSACCPKTNEAMYRYGKLRDKILAAKAIQERNLQKKTNGLFGFLR